MCSAQITIQTILKMLINSLASRWNTTDGRPAGKNGRMDVMLVYMDILHELVDDFDLHFPTPGADN